MRKLKYLYYRILWNLAPYLPYGKIVHIDIELNNNCNQKCLSCWHNGKPPFKIEYQDEILAKQVLFDSKKSGVKSVKFNLRGEPLLSPILLDCIRKAKELNYTDIMINTNGTLLTRETILELNEAGLTTLIISVDSFVKETYCKIHNCQSIDFNKLMVVLMDIEEFYKRKLLNFKTKLNFHVNKYNEGENFFKSGSRFSENMFPVIRYTQNRHGEKISVDTKKKKRKKVCPHMMRRITVLSNIKVYPCCVCYDEPEDIRLNSVTKRRELIDNYKKGIYTESCKNCTSGDIYK